MDLLEKIQFNRELRQLAAELHHPVLSQDQLNHIKTQLNLLIQNCPDDKIRQRAGDLLQYIYPKLIAQFFAQKTPYQYCFLGMVNDPIQLQQALMQCPDIGWGVLLRRNALWQIWVKHNEHIQRSIWSEVLDELLPWLNTQFNLIHETKAKQALSGNIKQKLLHPEKNPIFNQEFTFDFNTLPNLSDMGNLSKSLDDLEHHSAFLTPSQEDDTSMRMLDESVKHLAVAFANQLQHGQLDNRALQNMLTQDSFKPNQTTHIPSIELGEAVNLTQPTAQKDAFSHVEETDFFFNRLQQPSIYDVTSHVNTDQLRIDDPQSVSSSTTPLSIRPTSPKPSSNSHRYQTPLSLEDLQWEYAFSSPYLLKGMSYYEMYSLETTHYLNLLSLTTDHKAIQQHPIFIVECIDQYHNFQYYTCLFACEQVNVALHFLHQFSVQHHQYLGQIVQVSWDEFKQHEHDISACCLLYHSAKIIMKSVNIYSYITQDLITKAQMIHIDEPAANPNTPLLLLQENQRFRIIHGHHRLALGSPNGMYPCIILSRANGITWQLIREQLTHLPQQVDVYTLFNTLKQTPQYQQTY